jgi:ADP-ribose pyrophosphatase YjhB (NUDIX family)
MKKVEYNSEDILNHHGVSAVIKNEKGEILMQEHIKYGFWTIPVGKVKEGQSIEEGLKDELFEECNIFVEEIKELLSKKLVYNRDGNNVKVHSHLFEIIKFKGEIKNNEPNKHKKQKFLSIDEVKKLPYLSDMTILYLRKLGFKRQAHL